jgi:hypothetical protein
MKFFAGIGSRTIPKTVAIDMENISKCLTQRGYILRSGNATGSDQAFAKGVHGKNAQIWLPWKDFEQEFQDLYPEHRYRLVGDECCPGEPDPEAWDSVEKFHPYFKKMLELKDTSRSDEYYRFMRFMSRNYRQVRGWGEADSEFVICWTHDGTDVGGTGQAIRIANHYGIPVFNMFDKNAIEIIREIDKYLLIN